MLVSTVHAGFGLGDPGGDPVNLVVERVLGQELLVTVGLGAGSRSSEPETTLTALGFLK